MAEVYLPLDDPEEVAYRRGVEQAYAQMLRFGAAAPNPEVFYKVLLEASTLANNMRRVDEPIPFYLDELEKRLVKEMEGRNEITVMHWPEKMTVEEFVEALTDKKDTEAFVGNMNRLKKEPMFAEQWIVLYLAWMEMN